MESLRLGRLCDPDPVRSKLQGGGWVPLLPRQPSELGGREDEVVC